MAEKGAGVWLRGQKLKLASFDPAVEPVGVVGSRVRQLISDPSVMPQGGDAPAIDIGSCAGFDYPRLFTGAATFANAATKRANFLFYRHTNAWDHVPGMFLHQEGGGYSATWDGTPYDLKNKLAGLLYAPDRDTWQRLYNFFGPLMDHARKKAP